MVKEPEKVDRMETAGKKRLHMVVAMLLAAVLVVAASLFVFVRYSQRVTENAVHSASLFYLEELASNVSQVYATHFDGYFKELKLALLTTEETELDDEAALNRHLVSMEERGGFLYYALLDEDGNIYISDLSYLSPFLMDFLHNSDFSGHEVSIELRDGDEDVFIIGQAAPENTFANGKRIVAGAKGIAASKVRTEILLRSENNDAFVHMIKPDGTYIIAGDNNKLVHSDNYFHDLSDTAEFSKRDTLEGMMLDIQNQQNGVTSYYVDGELYYGHYFFLSRSGWSVVVTVPFSTINATMEEMLNRVTMAGIVLMVLMVSLLSMFFYIYSRQRKESLELDMKRLEAEERNRAKSSFLSSMSHDIRTPMNAIVGFTNLAMQQDVNPRVQDYLLKISTSSNHLLNLINDILDMSRIESGKMSIEESVCELPELFHGLRTIIQGQVNAKRQQLHMEIDDVVNETVWCDKVRLNQVLLNFLSNAIKFTPVGGTITVRVVQKASNRPGYGAYAFHVKDTGIGMSEQFSKQVFEPFEREKSDTVREIQGTGLGMSIVKNIVDLMGGTIDVETMLGKGTEFIVHVDLKLLEEAETVSAEELKKIPVLLLGDGTAACDSIVKMLQHLEMDAEVLQSAQEAVQKLQQGSYAAMLLFSRNVDDDVLRMIGRLRDAAGTETPLLMLSSCNGEEPEEKVVQAGAAAFCGQPVFMSDLCRVLLELMSRGEAGENVAAEMGLESFEGKRILLAEDNELNCEIATEVLQSYGFAVETAENGQVALEMVENSAPGYYDVVLMDIQMPVMDGYTAARAIRSLTNPELANVPILAMTANAFEEDRQNSLNAGMNGHITKPLDMEVLLEVLRQHL